MTKGEKISFDKERLKKACTQKDGGFKKVCEAIGLNHQTGLYYLKTKKIPLSVLHSFARYLNVSTDYLIGTAEAEGNYSIVPENEADQAVLNFVNWIYSDQNIFPNDYLSMLAEIRTILIEYAEKNNQAEIMNWTPEYHLFTLIIKAINEDKANIKELYKIALNAATANDAETLEQISKEQLHIRIKMT